MPSDSTALEGRELLGAESCARLWTGLWLPIESTALSEGPEQAGLVLGGAAGHTRPHPAVLGDCEPPQSHASPSAGRQSASGLATQLSAGLFFLVQCSLSHLEDTERFPHHHCQRS